VGVKEKAQIHVVHAVDRILKKVKANTRERIASEGKRQRREVGFEGETGCAAGKKSTAGAWPDGGGFENSGRVSQNISYF